MRFTRKMIRKISLALCAVMLLTGAFPAEVSAAAKNFNKKKTIAIAAADDFAHTQKYTWIKYKAPNYGFITITASGKAKAALPGTDGISNSAAADGTGLLCLFDSKKKTPLSGEFAYNTAGGNSAAATVVYGVKKNTTYYLRVQAQGAVSVKCKFTKTAKSSASKKAKALSLKKGKLAKGILAAGEDAADWYKITVPKKQYLNFYYSGKANGKIQLTFSGAYLNTAKRYVIQGSELENRAYTIERVQPGNYYIKVERADKLSSGYYTLKWN